MPVERKCFMVPWTLTAHSALELVTFEHKNIRKPPNTPVTVLTTDKQCSNGINYTQPIMRTNCNNVSAREVHMKDQHVVRRYTRRWQPLSNFGNVNKSFNFDRASSTHRRAAIHSCRWGAATAPPPRVRTGKRNVEPRSAYCFWWNKNNNFWCFLLFVKICASWRKQYIDGEVQLYS